MKLYNHLDEFSTKRKAVATIGIFDGVHPGHRKVLSRLAQSAEDAGGESVILSFFPHPRTILGKPDDDIRLINTLDEKISLLEQTGIQHLIIHPFDKAFSEIPADRFIEEVLVGKLRLSRLVIGHDHRFGKDRQGSYSLLQTESVRFGFEMEEIPALDLKNISISSSRIRKALLEGNIQAANELLGYRFFMRGSVIQGDKIGRTINFPTANIYIEENYKLIPAEGVYAVKVSIGPESYSGMLNIGRRPTLPGKQLSMEVHLLNFNRDIYGENIQVNFVKRIRDEVRFDNLSLLEEQLKKDRETVKLILE